VDGNFRRYSFADSSERIAAILDQPSGAFQEDDGLPDRERLTYTNGFYGMCAAIFVDIRDSSGLTARHNRPRLAKIYRAFISEMVAVLNSDLYVREVNIVGDCVWAVYKTTHTAHIDDVFTLAFKANTLVQLLNHHLEKRDIAPLKVGIGVDYGRVLMIKAGFSGSGINDVIYMGDVVNRAAHLAHHAARGRADPIFVGEDFEQYLNDHNSGLLTQRYITGIGRVRTGSVIDIEMHEWIAGLK